MSKTDRNGVEVPLEYQQRNLVEDICPCGGERFLEQPAGYYTCQSCFSTWAGDPTEADIVEYMATSTE